MLLEGFAGWGPADVGAWRERGRRAVFEHRVSRAGVAGAVTHFVILLALCGWSGVTHYQTGSLAGPYAYLFLAASLVVFGVLAPMKRAVDFISLRGVVEIWFLLDYVAYATLLCSGVRSKIPLPVSAGDAYSQSYLVGALAVLCWGVGVRLGLNPAKRNLVVARLAGGLERRRIYLISLVFGLFFLAAAYGFTVLLSNPEVWDRILFRGFGFSPPPGLGRYSSIAFILPSTGVALVYLATLLFTTRSAVVRVTAMVLCGLLSAVHLMQGRRLIWASTMLMAGYLLRKSGALRPRWWHIAAPLLILLPASVYFEQNKNAGWITAQSFSMDAATNPENLVETFRNSVGRFDITAAVLSNRPRYGYYHGRTFLESFLHVLPTSLVPERPLGIGQEIGELIYNNFYIRLVSQAGSLIAELYANFGWAGVACVFAVMGWLSAKMDMAAIGAGPIGALGYAFALFRFPHHLVVASYAATPLTLWALSPFLVALLMVTLIARTPRPEGGRI
jgi:hypothetical protein